MTKKCECDHKKSMHYKQKKCGSCGCQKYKEDPSKKTPKKIYYQKKEEEDKYFLKRQRSHQKSLGILTQHNIRVKDLKEYVSQSSEVTFLCPKNHVFKRTMMYLLVLLSSGRCFCFECERELCRRSIKKEI